MAILRVDDFKGKLTGGGARPNLFDVNINFPAYVSTVSGNVTEATNFLCKAAQLPGSTMGMIPVPFRGRQVKVAGDRTFEPWTITIINDTDFAIRDAFEVWMNGINGHESNTGLTNPVTYQSDMDVRQLDKDGDVLKTYRLRGAFPTAITPIDLAYDANDAIEEFQVTLEFQYWVSGTTS